MRDDRVPDVIPVFPLTGSLLLPGNWLPLNIFEPRYCNMVEDALAAGRHIGMIQPTVPRQDNWVEAGNSSDEAPELYSIGCAGRIEQCDRQPDGRFVILLKGVRRFRVREELPPSRGYRRVAADYDGFTDDLAELETTLDPARLIQAVRAFSEKHGLSFDWDVLGSLPGVSLLNGLAVALPFRPEEKQALLEAVDVAEREELILILMGMGIEPLEPDDYYSPPILN